MRKVEALFLGQADLIITTSEATINSVREIVRQDKRFLVAYPGLDKHRMRTRREGSLERQGEKLNLLVVSSVTRRKDIKTLVKAVKTLAIETTQTSKTPAPNTIDTNLSKLRFIGTLL